MNEDEIRKMYQSGVSVEEIRRKFGMISFWNVKKIGDPEWYEQQRLKRRDRTIKESSQEVSLALKGRRVSATRLSRVVKEERKPLFDPRKDTVTYHTNFTSWMAGDPPPGRSALDQRRMALAGK